MGAVGGVPAPLDLDIYCGDLFVVQFQFNDGGASVLTVPATLPQSVITVVSTGQAPTAGTIQVGGVSITYTGKSATTFTGCTGGSGSFPVNTPVTWTPVAIDVSGYTPAAKIRPTPYSSTVLATLTFDVSLASSGIWSASLAAATTPSLNPVANQQRVATLAWDLNRTSIATPTDIRTWYAGAVLATQNVTR